MPISDLNWAYLWDTSISYKSIQNVRVENVVQNVVEGTYLWKAMKINLTYSTTSTCNKDYLQQNRHLMHLY